MTTPTTPAADAVRDLFEIWYVGHMKSEADMDATPQEIAAMRKGDEYGNRGYLNGAWHGYSAAAARESALVAERDQLHAIVGQCLSALGNGSGAAPEASIAFLAGAPDEIGLHVAGLVAERDALRAALQKVVDWGPFPRVPDEHSDEPGATISYGVAYGSNGQRDYIRGIARAALAAPAVEG